jgi:hypothetical protein
LGGRIFLYDLKFHFSNLSIIQYFISFLNFVAFSFGLNIERRQNSERYLLEGVVNPNSKHKLSAFNTSRYIFDQRFYSSKSIENLNEPLTIRKRKGPVTPFASEPTDHLKEVIFGLMLGDLSAERYSSNGGTRLRFYMSSINKEYAAHLYFKFKEYVKTPPKEITRKINKLTGKIHTDVAFSTLKYSFFNWVMEDFYKKDPVLNRNIKILPLNAENQFTGVSLAFWIMDDGSYNKIKQNLTLCTDAFSEQDVLRLIEILKTKFNLSCGLILYDKKK